MLIRSLTLALGLLAPLGAASAEPVAVALDWTLNTNHIGFVVAEARGLYDAAGLEVELLPYADAASTAVLAITTAG